MAKTVEEVINFLWANNSRGGVDVDGIAGIQCVDLPKAVMQFCGEPSWNKARGNAKDVVDNLIADGVATAKPTGQNRIKVVSGTGGILDPTYGHIWIEVDKTIFAQNNTVALPVGAFGNFNNRKEAYLKCISGTAGVSTPQQALTGSTATVMADTLNVRSAPNTSGQVVAQYSKGQQIHNLSYVGTSNGYAWFTYISASGAKRYVASGRATGKVESDDFLKF